MKTLSRPSTPRARGKAAGGVENGTAVSGSRGNYDRVQGWKVKPFGDVLAILDSDLVVFLELRNRRQKAKGSRWDYGCFRLLNNATTLEPRVSPHDSSMMREVSVFSMDEYRTRINAQDATSYLEDMAPKLQAKIRESELGQDPEPENSVSRPPQPLLSTTMTMQHSAG